MYKSKQHRINFVNPSSLFFFSFFSLTKTQNKQEIKTKSLYKMQNKKKQKKARSDHEDDGTEITIITFCKCVKILCKVRPFR